MDNFVSDDLFLVSNKALADIYKAVERTQKSQEIHCFCLSRLLKYIVWSALFTVIHYSNYGTVVIRYSRR